MIRSYLSSHSDRPAIIHAAIGTYMPIYSFSYTNKINHLGALSESGDSDVIIYCPTRFDQRVLVKIHQIELGSNGPVLSLAKTANANGDRAHSTIATPEVEAEVTATDMMLVHNIDKLLEEAEVDDQSIDSLNGLHAGDVNVDNGNGQLGTATHLFSFIHTHLLTRIRNKGYR